LLFDDRNFPSTAGWVNVASSFEGIYRAGAVGGKFRAIANQHVEMIDINNYIARQFRKPSGFGGRAVSFVMNYQNRPLYDKTIKLLSPSDNEKILDIGCGNGYVLEVLANRYNCEYVGIDTSSSILKSAKKRNKRLASNSRITFECCDVIKMPFNNEAFDKIYTINTVYFWEDLHNTMSEIKRVLKPSGRFVNTLYTNETLSRLSHARDGYKLFSQKDLLKAANDVGFKTEIIPTMQGQAYCIVCDYIK